MSEPQASYNSKGDHMAGWIIDRIHEAFAIALMLAVIVAVMFAMTGAFGDPAPYRQSVAERLGIVPGPPPGYGDIAEGDIPPEGTPGISLDPTAVSPQPKPPPGN